MKHNTRCSICNKVSSREIETNAYDHSDKPFVPDPVSKLHWVCHECKESHEELMGYYENKYDDPWGWDVIDLEIEDFDEKEFANDNAIVDSETV